jgi:hypothetical protein
MLVGGVALGVILVATMVRQRRRQRTGTTANSSHPHQLRLNPCAGNRTTSEDGVSESPVPHTGKEAKQL